MAAPAKYNSAYHDNWAWSLAIKGATDEEIAEAFGVAKRTVLRWKKDHPSFVESLEEGKNVADAKVERKLYQRALGYDAEETEKVVDVDANGNTKPVRVKTTKKHIAPDVMAQMYWLNNRKRGDWTQRQDVNLSGSIKTSPMENLTEDELRNLAKLDEEPDGD